MEHTPSVAQYLETLSEGFQEDIDYRIFHFLQRISTSTFKNLDVYCFRDSSEVFFRIFHVSGSVFSLIHPLPHSSRALSLSLVCTYADGETGYSLSAGTFDLTKTAGDPVDLAAIRGEKIILDITAGETPESIRMHGAYRDYVPLFTKRYLKRSRSGLPEWWRDLFLPKKKKAALRQIVHDLANLDRLMRRLIANPSLNRLRSRTAFNY